VPSALIRHLEDELPMRIAPLDVRDVDSGQLLVPGRVLHLSGARAYKIITHRREVVIERFERPAWARSVRFADGDLKSSARMGGGYDGFTPARQFAQGAKRQHGSGRIGDQSTTESAGR
jgi:hypothetical protein